jgi:hypothetical protein
MSLGLDSCKGTLVGNGMIRGVSGGQKRRVTVGEMVSCPRPVKYMDCISNGLDAATTFDIIQACAHLCHTLALTQLISLLQVTSLAFFALILLIKFCHSLPLMYIAYLMMLSCYVRVKSFTKVNMLFGLVPASFFICFPL